jgi:hypothetical protein
MTPQRGSKAFPPEPSEWRFKVKRSKFDALIPRHQFIAWCAKTDELGDGPMDVDFSLEVHFEFGATAEDALRKLKQEVCS